MAKDKPSKDRVATIAGRTFIIAPLGLRDLDLAEEEALKQYKKRAIQTFTDNADELDGVMTKDEIKAEVLKLSQMTADDLPQKSMTLPVINQETGKIVMIPEKDENDQLTGFKVPKTNEVPIDYGGWWLAETIAGKVLAIWLSLRTHHPNITREEADNLFKAEDGTYNEAELEDIANQVGAITQPTVGTAKNE